MNNLKISYLITCHDETDTLKRLIERIYNHLGNDELVILQDESTWDRNRKKYLTDITELSPSEKIINLPIFIHSLNTDYGAHKNYGIEKCSGDYIFQCDGDELPPETLLGENLHAILDSNPTVEAYVVPRINDFRGVTEKHAQQWGWKLTTSKLYNRPIVNFPDYQLRIFKKDYPRISFRRRLHEKIEGHSSYSTLPGDEDFALYHDKTIETQLNTNKRYNEWFSAEENQGHKGFA